jgi:hypothetical protein
MKPWMMGERVNKEERKEKEVAPKIKPVVPDDLSRFSDAIRCFSLIPSQAGCLSHASHPTAEWRDKL